MAGTAATDGGGTLGLTAVDNAGVSEDAAGVVWAAGTARGAGGGCGSAWGAGPFVTPSAGATTIVSSAPPGTIAVVTAPARSSTRRVTGGSALFRATRTRRTMARPVRVGGTAPGDTPGRSMKTRGGPSVVGVAVATGSVAVPRTVIRTYGPSRATETAANGTPEA